MMLALRQVSHGFGGRHVLSDFSLSLGAGEQALLLGPSGSGKTTLIYLCCGLLTPDRGAVAIDGADLTKLSQSQRDDVRRRGIGVVFQTLRLVSALSVRANLLLAQRLARKKQDSRAVDALLERLGIAHRGGAKPAALSQGEAQRAAIARAVITRPRLLIADEPTSALDDANAERVAALLVETAHEHGCALLIATHDARLRGVAPKIVELAPITESIAIANRTPGVEALILTASGAAHASRAWDALVVRDEDAATRLTPVQENTATPWPADFQLEIEIELPAIEAFNYRKPYVLVWITDANRQPVRTLLMLGQHERWQDDNYVWWRRIGRLTPGIVEATARPTRAPGRYALVWDGRDDAGQIVGQGAYKLNIEAVREHGGHSYVSAPLTLGAAPFTANTPADAELGAASASYGPRR